VTDGRYYDADTSECLACDEDLAGSIATFVCVVLVMILLIALFLYFRPDRKVECLVQFALRLHSLYTQMNLRVKCSKPH